MQHHVGGHSCYAKAGFLSQWPLNKKPMGLRAGVTLSLIGKSD
jgi:hypothetical protein